MSCELAICLIEGIDDLERLEAKLAQLEQRVTFASNTPVEDEARRALTAECEAECDELSTEIDRLLNVFLSVAPTNMLNNKEVK